MESPVYYRIFWFDEPDYDTTRFVTPDKYDTEDEAAEALRTLFVATLAATGPTG